MNENSDLYLAHHGIKGQKWGVRRFQNTDGTYTSQGKNRRNKALKKITNILPKIDNNTKEKIVKGLGTAAVVGGIAAYGKVNGGKGPVDSYIKGITTAGDKLSGRLYKQSAKLSRRLYKQSAKRRKQSKTKYDDMQDGPIYTKNGKIVDDIPDEVLEKEFAKQRAKSIKHSDLYLAHHGIKGQKWGVRRYQNTDGTLTTAGKKHKKIAKNKKVRKKLTPSQKAMLKGLGIVGLEAAVTLGTIYGADKLIDRQYKKEYAANKEQWDKEREEARQRAKKQADMWEEARKKAREDRRKAYEEYKKDPEGWRKKKEEEYARHRAYWGDYSYANRQQQSNQQSSKYRPKVKQDTSKSKSKDREKKYRDIGVKLDPEKAEARVRELRDKVSKAQKDGTVTPEMINELQEAMAIAKVARSQMAHSFGFICYILRDDPNSLSHHGIKGMHWGVRRFEDANGHLTPEGKRRYAVQDARKYYKINRLQRAQEKNRDPDKNERLSKRIRRVQTRSDRKHADLSQRDINVGRQIVAKNRRNWAMVGTAAKAAATAAGAYALYKNPNTRALAPLALAGGAALTYGSAKKVPYYAMEARRYKQVNPKGATKKGLTKKQQALRTAGKVAAGAALAGAAGYTLYKSGAGEAAINAGKNALEARTGINFGKNSSGDFDKNSINDTPSKSKSSGPSESSSKIYDAAKQYSQSQKANSSTSKPKSVSESSQRIYDAAKQYTQNQKAKSSTSKPESVRESSRRIYEAAKGAAGKQAKKAISTAKDKARSTVRNKVMDGVDEDDPRTWINAVKGAKDTISDIRRYGRAINKTRKGDTIGAAAEVSDELTDATNKLIEGTQSAIDKAKSGRGSRKSKLK